MLNVSYLNELRRLEIEQLVPRLPPGCRVLEFGSGTGEQARFLADQGFEVTAIDLADSNYAADRIFPILNYDGHKIPVEDHSIDVIFSSNVLEHVENLDEIADEFRRVLKPDGFAIHVLPTAVWRSWSLISAVGQSFATAAKLPRHLIRPPVTKGRAREVWRDFYRIIFGFVPRPHGTGRSGLAELWTFSRPAWLSKFNRLGFDVIDEQPIGLFYTGTMLLGPKVPISMRRRLSRNLGSVTRLYVVKPRR